MAQFDLHEIAFPTLTDKQVEQLGGCTGAKIPRSYSAGDVLVQVGDRNFRFFVIRRGEIEILDESGDEPRTIAVHGPGEFTGDVSHLTGTPAIFRPSPAATASSTRSRATRCKQVINQCPDLGDIVLQAFIARRQLMRESARSSGLRVIGSRYSPRYVPHPRLPGQEPRALHVDSTSSSIRDVEQLLKHFGADGGRHAGRRLRAITLLRNPTNRELAERIGIRKPLETEHLRPRGRRRGARRARRRGLRRVRGTADASSSNARPPAARPAAACASRTTSAFRRASPAASSPSAPCCRRTSSVRVLSIPAPVTRRDVRRRLSGHRTSTAARTSWRSAC